MNEKKEKKQMKSKRSLQEQAVCSLGPKVDEGARPL